MAGQTILERDLGWLRELHGKLWEDKDEHSRFGSRTVKVALPRRLTDVEWAHVRAVVEEHHLPVTMVNTRFGFGVGMFIYGPEREALYPGVEEETKPEAITMVSQAHLPESESSFEHDNRIMFNDGWRCFEPLTHAEPNFDRLRRCQLKKPGTKNDYAY